MPPALPPQPALPPRIALFARFPEAGAAKTRLIPALGADGAARVHRLLVERTMARIRASALPFAVRFTGASRSDFADWLGEDVELVEQGGGDLGMRMARVEPPAILLGADIPLLEARHLTQAADALQSADVVLGPARDGGYYLLGCNRRIASLFDGIEWGSSRVLSDTLERSRSAGVEPVMLEMLDDCDRPADLARHPGLLA